MLIIRLVEENILAIACICCSKIFKPPLTVNAVFNAQAPPKLSTNCRTIRFTLKSLGWRTLVATLAHLEGDYFARHVVLFGLFLRSVK